MEKFRDKYRIPSARLKNWNYGWDGLYFVTICTAGNHPYFGTVAGGKMILSDIGNLAYRFWKEIQDHFPFIELDAFVIMPNHVHGILIINLPPCTDAIYRVSDPKNDCLSHPRNDRFPNPIAANDNNNDYKRDAINRVCTGGGITGMHNPMLHENLSRIIRWYKGRTAFESHRIDHEFEWHERFYDHIIRSDESFERIREYIELNPRNWDNDKFYN